MARLGEVCGDPVVRVARSIGVVVVGAVLALAHAGCGSSQEQAATDTASPAPTVTATATGDETALERMPEVPTATTSTRPPTSADDTDGSAFLTSVFEDAQAMWTQEFQAAGIRYAPARITIFRDEVQTACGLQSASVGPFYCPADSGVYLDRRFFDALATKAGVRLGDFAQAYVVAHEVAHHVQMLLGTMQRVAAENQADPASENARSVRLEADDQIRARQAIRMRHVRGMTRTTATPPQRAARWRGRPPGRRVA